ncbi:DNA repair protein rad2 [Saxophila tyrrhenica]|uniref:DNA repair protein rad2 n=1 Tax=Saxophila tyrrhenica TaxID=1690608 RepID=A0AAV9PDK8_9PEZI|nr:DNA repair protein rad2 [Saxophila tyrrhenica]
MGVTGLWQILHPCARPIKLETLNRKRLAVDASIWIYQFLKAVRDKEGNALRNSHVVGFFRRICKLLFFGIKPVFVFDGGAPALKRQTLSNRKKRREGRREDAVRTAGRLLAVQMQRRAEEDEQKRKDDRDRKEQEEEVPDEGLVYADENLMTQQERQQSRKFRKKDQYHLPELDVSLSEMGAPNDPRVMSLEELQTYAKQFETGEDINVYDFSKIDYDSSFFMSLPASDRYNILNAARLRSRLRMGHSKDQLDSMFPDRMEFSRFQIERVTERNELTQRLMHINEGGDALFNGRGRVAGEKGREYVLVKNDGVEGGWALGVISDEGTKQETAIDLDKPAVALKQDEDEWEDDNDFEDVPIEGLNRLPKRPTADLNQSDDHAKQRQAFYKSRQSTAKRKPKPKKDADPNSLFVPDEPNEDEAEEWEEVDGNAELFGEENGADEDEELNRAIALSLESNEQDADQSADAADDQASDAEEDDMLEVFNQSAVPEARPVPKGSGRAIANIVNKRAYDSAPDSHEVTSFGVPAPRSESPKSQSENEDDTMDFQAALAESRRTKRKVSPPARRKPAGPKPADQATQVAKNAGFSGPLPFEKLDLGSSLLGKKKMQARTEETAGGFENPELEGREKKKAEPLPPWFSGSLDEDISKQRALENEDRERAKEFNQQFQFQRRDEGGLRRHDTNEVIDLDAEEEQRVFKNGEVIDLEAEDEQTPPDESTAMFDPDLRMGDVAEKARVEPPQAPDVAEDQPVPLSAGKAMPFDMDDSDDEASQPSEPEVPPKVANGGEPAQPLPATTDDQRQDSEDEEMLEWSESEDGEAAAERPASNSKADDARSKTTDRQASRSPIIDPVNAHAVEAYPSRQSASQPVQKQPSRSPSVEFEDVDMADRHSPDKDTATPASAADEMDAPVPASGMVHQDTLPEDVEEYDDFSDPEDEELLRGLTLEAEEHARFASSLNNKTQAQNIADYEKELKQLRNQQKKDRRDADEVTHIMVQECQQLLRLFGLPYVTAPMEAEAQCAELVKLGLVDGIVTDDSDCFLFGGTRIYKNMFNQAKFVECYLTSDLEKEFDLTRDKMISVAQLLGSDYTEGLPGIGPVTALEIISEFPSLVEFKDWLNGVQLNTITKADDAGNAFRKKFRRTATKLFPPAAFPDTRVQAAYKFPDIDADPEQFQWGVPDLDALRSFLMATIGWSQERTDEVLVPVIKDMNRRADEGTQANITAFFDGGVGIGAAGATKSTARGEAFAPRRRAAESSKRMGSALSRMAEKAKLTRGESAQEGEGAHLPDGAAIEQDAAVETTQKGSKSKKGKSSKRTSVASSDDEASEFEQPKKKKPRKPAPAKAGRGQGKA